MKRCPPKGIAPYNGERKGRDSRHSDIRVYDKNGKLKQTVKNYAIFAPGLKESETVR